MAIIRKGDKVAEDKLKARAKAEPKPHKHAGSILDPKTPRSVYIKKDSKTGKTTAQRVDISKDIKITNVKSPISGKKVAEARKYTKDLKPNAEFTARKGSGVIQSGKLVKGGSKSLEESLDKKGKK